MSDAATGRERSNCTDPRCPGPGAYWWGYYNCQCVPSCTCDGPPHRLVCDLVAHPLTRASALEAEA